jgi:hypothetical protein
MRMASPWLALLELAWYGDDWSMLFTTDGKWQIFACHWQASIADRISGGGFGLSMPLPGVQGQIELGEGANSIPQFAHSIASTDQPQSMSIACLPIVTRLKFWYIP